MLGKNVVFESRGLKATRTRDTWFNTVFISESIRLKREFSVGGKRGKGRRGGALHN